MARRKVAFDASPTSWQELERFVAQFFREMGCETSVGRTVSLPRGSVKVDVLVEDPIISPAARYVIECKYWRRRVPKEVVHAFRTVTNEIGADRGFLVATGGFQVGAKEAAVSTNVQLVTWAQLQTLYFDRWLATTTAPFHAMSRRIAVMLAYPEKDDFSDNTMWRGRDLIGDSWSELEELRTRYAALTTWALVKAGVPVSMYLKFALPMQLAGAPTRFTSYRTLVDWFPLLYRDAENVAQRFLEEKTALRPTWDGSRTS